MIRRGLLLLPFLLSALAAPLAADDHPNTERGFAAEKAFAVGEVDSVNVYNGNLVLTIPIGGTYPVGGALGYSLILVYNSSAWDFQEREDLPSGQTYTQALPQKTANAGLGWTLTLGRLLPPGLLGNDTGLWVYLGADAAEHLFYPTLHAGDADEAGDTTANQIVSYTRDGSYLRKRNVNANDLVVEFPDGKVQHFDGAGNLTKIEDRFGNFLTVTYSDLLWTLTDSQGRSQKVSFQNLTQDGRQVPSVSTVELTAFGSPTATATYSFSYSPPTTISRACPGNDPAIGPTTQVQLLTGVTLPDGSSYQMPLADYVTDAPNAGGSCRWSGAIRGLGLPTLGRIEWTYQNYTFPAESGKAFRQSTAGVATRRRVDAAGGDQGTWTYQTRFGPPVQPLPVPIYGELINTVTDPLGHWTEHYYSVYASGGSTVWSAADYSLPFTRNTTDGAGRYLSTRTYAMGETTPLRSSYVLYDRDQVPAGTISKQPFQDRINTNRRQQSTRTVYSDDGDHYADVTSSDFDGLGHYRSETTGGDFPAANVRTATTTYNSARGTYQIDPATNQPASGHTFTRWPASQPWVLETFTSRRVDEAASTAATLACFDAATGFLLRQRILKNSGTAESPNDVVTAYTQAQGNLTAEQYFGGDRQTLTANGTTCTMPLGTPAYEIDHTYQSGVRASSQYLGATFKSLDQDIDSRTGLPSASRDSAGLATDSKYDTLGRLTWSQPRTAGQDGWTEYVYTPATSASALANVLVRRRQNGGETEPVLAKSQFFFDSFGRIWQEKRTLPSGSLNVRETLYDKAGNKASVSELQTGAATRKTLFSGYDPFGRATTIQPADGAAHAVAMSYYGVRVMDRAVKIATAAGTETSATTTEVYDRQGRLWRVTEPSGDAGANVTTSYKYDIGNRLRQVTTTAGSVTQNRFFTYDNLGFLRSETHPEKGASGNGIVSYPIYDARGHAWQKVDGPNDLSFIYDAAERLTQVKETGTASQAGRVLKTFSYAGANGTNDWSQGKLQQASRYNYVTASGSPITVQVTETYTYGGRDGRVSRRDTQASTGEAFTQSFTYNDLGLASSLTYPACTHAGCTQAAPAVFNDVPVGYWAQLEIEGIRKAGITDGCLVNPLRYCPEAQLLRSQMAVFLVKAAAGSTYTPPACTGIFADVPCPSQFANWIEDLYHRGITAGCTVSPLQYCPNNSVSNTQMAIFLLRSKEGASYQPPPCSAPPFLDVSCAATGSAAWIVEAARRQLALSCAPGSFCPDTPLTRAQMAVLLARGFDFPVTTDPNTSRTIQFAYTQGLLTSVTDGVTTYGTLSYHPNLLVSQILHGNGVTETQGNDPNQMRRPSSLSASGAYASWSSGDYGYDGAGNIKTIGTSWFAYDKVNRLVSATLYDGATGGGTQKQQSYTFDAFGNLTNIAGTIGRATPTSAQTNRLNGTGTVYDAAGNLTNWNGAVYQYDAFNQMIHMTSGTEDWVYLYTADDERVWSYNVAKNSSRWALRDLGGKVLREYQNDGGRWSVGTDYIYRDGLLLAAETQTGRRHFHLDHLGTPRLITRASGYPAGYHVYYPFGEEATAFNQDPERMKFTGHERDLASPTGAGDDLDYMHARHCSPVTGRFHSVDPAMESADPFTPQSWNRYNYVQGNPLVYTDPTGELLVFTGSSANLEKLRKLVNDSLHGYELVISKNGTAQLVTNNVQGPASPEQAALAGVLSTAINRSEVISVGVESGANDILTGNYDMETIDIQDMGALGSGPAVSAASALAHEIAEQTAKQVFGLEYEKAHARAEAAQNSVSGFTRGRINTDLLDRATGNGYTLTEQRQGSSNVQIIIKWVNGNIVKVIRK